MSEQHGLIDKAGWGPGPWQDEPDRVEWRHAGMVCLVTRHDEMGHLCGYVGVPEGHPHYGKSYEALPEEVHAHGGVNYGKPCAGKVCHVPAPGESDVYWFGFDCGHAWDFQPGLAAITGEGMHIYWRDTTYRELAYVKVQCERLAEQLAGARS